MTFAGTKLLCRNQRMMRCYELSPDAEPRPAKVWSVRAPTVITSVRRAIWRGHVSARLSEPA
jgi:hypothetical protein